MAIDMIKDFQLNLARKIFNFLFFQEEKSMSLLFIRIKGHLTKQVQDMGYNQVEMLHVTYHQTSREETQLNKCCGGKSSTI